MQSVIAFSCLLAVVSAGYLNNVAPLAYANTGSSAVAYNAPLVSAPHPVPVPIAHSYAVAPVAHAYAAPIAHAYAQAAPLALASEARLIDPVAIAAGAPLPTGDTVEVAAAKAAHFQAHAAAKGIAYSTPIAQGYAYGAPISHEYAHAANIPHGHAYGAPIALGHAHAAPLGLASEARLIDPVAIAAGAPLPTGDTVEVAAAKAFHHQAHVEAKTGHLLAKGHYLVKRSPGYLNAGYAGYAAPLAYAASPVRSYGYSAYSSPLAYSGYSGYGYGGHLGAYYG